MISFSGLLEPQHRCLPLRWLLLAVLVGVILRVYSILPSKRKVKKRSKLTCSLAVFLGSGGHTTEALGLLSRVDFARYTPRTYIVSDGDTLSAQKARSMETNGKYSIIYIPRARNVHQPLWSTPPTILYSLLACVKYFTLTQEGRPEVILLNGPGTCFIICAAVYLNKFLGLPAPRLIYVESFARVRTLSLSGKLLRYLVDQFVVQWPELLKDGAKGQCRGWLV